MEDKKQMKTRISMIGKVGSKLRHSNILAAAILSVLAAISLTSAQDASSKKSDKDAPAAVAVKSAIAQKLEGIKIDNIEFAEAPIQAVVAFLENRSVELDPEKKGVKIILNLDDDQMKHPPKVTITLKDIPLGDAIKYICKASGLEYTIANLAVIISASMALPDFTIEKELSKNGNKSDVPLLRARLKITWAFAGEYSGWIVMVQKRNIS